MPDEEYFAVVNDNPMVGGEMVVTGPGDDLDFYRDRKTALDRRDYIREEYENPDINVYRITVHEGQIEREDGGA